MEEPVRGLGGSIGLMLKSYKTWGCRRGYLASLGVPGSPGTPGGDAPDHISEMISVE